MSMIRISGSDFRYDVKGFWLVAAICFLDTESVPPPTQNDYIIPKLNPVNSAIVCTVLYCTVPNTHKLPNLKNTKLLGYFAEVCAL